MKKLRLSDRNLVDSIIGVSLHIGPYLHGLLFTHLRAHLYIGGLCLHRAAFRQPGDSALAVVAGAGHPPPTPPPF